MALGGGTWTSQNKTLPGSYINVKSVGGSVVTIGERGTVAMAIPLSWAPDGVFTVTAEEFVKNSMSIFAHSYTDDAMLPFREVLKHAQKVHVYNTKDDNGVAAKNFWATAKHKGSRGNDLKVVIKQNIDDSDTFDVTLYLDGIVVFTQTAKTGAELDDNPYVTWQTGALSLEAGAALTDGADGTESAVSHQNAMSAFESYSFNVLTCDTVTPSTLSMVHIEYTKRMRDDNGVKFQLVGYDLFDVDYEGVVSVKDKRAIWWVAGALAGCEINKSCTNMKYDGELALEPNYTQEELKDFIKNGVFAFHKVGDDVRVLMDINTLTTFTDDKGEIFAHNQTIRVVDQKHNDVKRIFETKYLGNIQNDSDGRASLYGDVAKLSEEYARMRAIEPYDSKSLTVEMGNTPNSVVVSDSMTIIGAMEKLYMTIICE